MYADKADWILQYSEREAIEFTDRVNPQTNTVNDPILNRAIENAEAELNVILSCCFSIKTIKDLYADSITIPILRKWTCEIARFLLAINLKSQSHKINQDYEEFKKQIDEICKCQGLIDSNGDEVPKKSGTVFAVVDEPGCYPKAFPCGCCFNDPCCCSEPSVAKSFPVDSSDKAAS